MRSFTSTRQFEILLSFLHRTGFDVARWPRRPDVWVMDWAMKQMLQACDINCVLDVGGNRGQFAQRIRALGYSGRIVSFEPSPSSLSTLNKAAARDASWQVRPVGLSSEAGEASLNLYGNTTFDSLHEVAPQLAAEEIHSQLPEFRRVDTATIALSTLAVEFPAAIAGISEPRVFLKSDTQGHDLEVLAGAKGLPPEVAAVLVELSAEPIYEGQPPMTMVMDTLFAEGFTPVAFEPVSRFADQRIIELDGLFMRPGKAGEKAGRRVPGSGAV